MTPWRRGLCLSVPAEGMKELEAAVRDLPPEIPLAEIRLDRFRPGEVRSGRWTELARDPGRTWVWTWRSPEEGGDAPRPPGILRRALEAGFSWLDVEARALEADDPEAHLVPVERRWVSQHAAGSPGSREGVRETWGRVRSHPAAMHKLVVSADRFEVNDWVLSVGETAAAEDRPYTVFAQGRIGHVSRVLGFLRGNAVTFVAPDRGPATAAGQPTVHQVLHEYALTRQAGMPALYGVLGNPVHGSRSPALHNRAFQLTGIDGLYLPLEALAPEPVLRWLRDGRLAGVSVTAPFKERCFDLVDVPESGAREVGAVNTVWRERGVLRGANTDLEAAREILAGWKTGPGQELALIGAGGAAGAVTGAARDLGFRISVFNRSASRGRAFSDRMQVTWAGALEALDPRGFDVVVNATPLGADAPLPRKLRNRGWGRCALLDLAYGEEETEWGRLARRAGGPYAGGLEFLARQAVGQFRRWTGREVPMEEIARETVR